MLSNSERIADYACTTGEGPLWHPNERQLYWVDIPNGRLFRYDPTSGAHEQCYERDGSIGAFTVQNDGDLLLFLDGGVIAVWNDNGDPLEVVSELSDEHDSRFNDVIADPEGRIFCGTMPTDEHPGRLYRLETDGSVERVCDDVALPNGFGFTPDLEHLYFNETEGNAIYRFDYDRTTGELTGRELFVDTTSEEGKPDGMTVDAAGHVWSAFWNGGCLVRYAPDGTPVERVGFPARKVSSVTFGGPTYLDAYVTTALGPAEGESGTKETEGDGAGALFRADLGVRGVPEFYSRIRL